MESCRAGRRLPLGVVVLTLLFSAAQDGQAGTEPSRTCELPAALRDTTGHVLLRFVLLGGKVNFVKPLFVVAEPSDRADALAKSVEQCLKESTYSVPGVLPGQSVEILQAFHYFPPTSGSDSIELGDGRRVARAHVEEMRMLRLELADNLLGGSDYVDTQETGWELRTNIKRREREVVMNTIRGAIRSFRGIFPRVSPLDASSDLVILLFESKAQFLQVAAFDRIFRGPTPAGQYDPVGQTAYTFVSRRDRPLKLSVDVLVHEVVHHLTHRDPEAQQREVPFWVSEGISVFVELLRPAKGNSEGLAAFERGKLKQTGYVWISSGTIYLDAVEAHRKAQSDLELDALLAGKLDRFSVEDAYGLSWVLVHYLINGEDGALREPFEVWLTGSMGTPGDRGIQAALGRTTEQFEAGVLQHLATMRR